MSLPQISAPSSVTGIQWADLKGSLLLFRVHNVEPVIATQFGDTSAVRADVYVLDGESAGDAYTDTLVFPKVLQGQIKSKAGGGYVLGRLEQGQKKAGQSPPWRLSAEITKADNAAATSFLTQQQQATGSDDPPF